VACSALVWAEGHYNGAVRTRKTTVAPPGGEEGQEEEAAAAGRRRSRQLRELYDSLAGEVAAAAGDSSRPSAALAPEDLTETEWFYLVCIVLLLPTWHRVKHYKFSPLPETDSLPSAGRFAECQTTGTRRTIYLSSANKKTLGKKKLDK
jgi:hypothetical protein